MNNLAVAFASVVPEIKLVAVVNTEPDGAVITGTANEPASALPPLPAAQKYTGNELQPVALLV